MGVLILPPLISKSVTSDSSFRRSIHVLGYNAYTLHQSTLIPVGTFRYSKGTVSKTAHVQVINQKWSDVLKFVICETKWRQQAEDNPHSHRGRRNNSGRKKSFLIPAAAGNRNERSREEEFGSKKISTSRGYRPNLKPRTVQQVTASSR